ncbi:MAG TPA: hypothetical protein VGM73_03785 [Candidatus Didemnitutus sp.]|jgi:hypothetical protein
MDSRPRLTFSWLGLAVAPWPALLVVSVLMTGNAKGFSLATFAVVAALGAPVAYAGTSALAVGLFLLGKRRVITRIVSLICGLVLAALEYLAFIYLSWSSGGPDSGPPVDSLLSHILREWNDPLLYAFLGCGVFTALFYDFIASRRPPHAASPAGVTAS